MIHHDVVGQLISDAEESLANVTFELLIMSSLMTPQFGFGFSDIIAIRVIAFELLLAVNLHEVSCECVFVSVLLSTLLAHNSICF